jgi:hypothetical protein
MHDFIEGPQWRVFRSIPYDGSAKKAGRDSSTAQADSFAGAKEEEKASACFARNDRWDAFGVRTVDGAGMGMARRWEWCWDRNGLVMGRYSLRAKRRLIARRYLLHIRPPVKIMNTIPE